MAAIVEAEIGLASGDALVFEILGFGAGHVGAIAAAEHDERGFAFGVLVG